MPRSEPLPDQELDELTQLVTPGTDIPFEVERTRDGRTWIHAADSALKAYRAVPRLAASVRELRRELASLQQEKQRRDEAARTTGAAAPAGARAPAPDAGHEEAADDLASLMSAPFRVSSRAAAAAKTDPLVALSVQVARALSEGAREIERARLIAMAFAAAQGDLDGFWEARRRRTTGPSKPSPKKTAAARTKATS